MDKNIFSSIVGTVSYLDTDVVDAASLVLLEEAGNGTLLTKRVKQLQLCVGKVYKHCCYAVLW